MTYNYSCPTGQCQYVNFGPQPDCSGNCVYSVVLPVGFLVGDALLGVLLIRVLKGRGSVDPGHWAAIAALALHVALQATLLGAPLYTPGARIVYWLSALSAGASLMLSTRRPPWGWWLAGGLTILATEATLGFLGAFLLSTGTLLSFGSLGNLMVTFGCGALAAGHWFTYTPLTRVYSLPGLVTLGGLCVAGFALAPLDVQGAFAVALALSYVQVAYGVLLPVQPLALVAVLTLPVLTDAVETALPSPAYLAELEILKAAKAKEAAFSRKVYDPRGVRNPHFPPDKPPKPDMPFVERTRAEKLRLRHEEVVATRRSRIQGALAPRDDPLREDAGQQVRVVHIGRLRTTPTVLSQFVPEQKEDIT